MMLRMKAILRPVHVKGSDSPSIYFSPLTAFLALIGSFLFQWHFYQMVMPVDASGFAKLGIFVMANCVPFSLLAGLGPPILVSLEKRWGFASVQRIVLVICFILILASWANPRLEISPVLLFFQVAGVITVLMLFLWPLLKFIGTRHDPKREKQYEEFILHNSVAALLRRGEIAIEEARIANPLLIESRALSSRLQSLPMQARNSIEREMVIERMVQDYRRKYGDGT